MRAGRLCWAERLDGTVGFESWWEETEVNRQTLAEWIKAQNWFKIFPII
jgi:hypothetical protein